MSARGLWGPGVAYRDLIPSLWHFYCDHRGGEMAFQLTWPQQSNGAGTAGGGGDGGSDGGVWWCW